MADYLFSLLTPLAALAAVAIGLPYLVLRGLRGGRRRGGWSGRGGRRSVRVGPSLPLMATLAALRRLDVVLLAAASCAVLVLVWANAQA